MSKSEEPDPSVPHPTIPQSQQPPPAYPVNEFHQQGPYPQPPYPPAQQVYVTQGVMVRSILGSNPTSMDCTNCRAKIVTRINRTNGLMAWLICGALCFFGFGFGCCLIPFCVDDCKDTEHYCPNCQTLLGIHKKIN